MTFVSFLYCHFNVSLTDTENTTHTTQQIKVGENYKMTKTKKIYYIIKLKEIFSRMKDFLNLHQKSKK